MPAILVASKMKSGLPKPVHSAVPVPHITAKATPQHIYVKPGGKEDSAKLTCLSHIPLKSPYEYEKDGDGLPQKKTCSTEKGFNTQIYTDWANHYLEKSGHKRQIKDLQQDVADGVLLAEIIQVVANEKIQDINSSPKNRSQMIENIDACLNFLAAKGINIQGLSSEEIRKGNLKAILGLFFSLSRYKQQQQQQQHSQKSQQHQHQHSSNPVSQQPVSALQLPQHQYVDGLQPSSQDTVQTQPYLQAQVEKHHHQLPQHAARQHNHHQQKAQQPEMQSRLPGPSTRGAAAATETKTHVSVSASNRRSQSFTAYDKSRPSIPPASSSEKRTSGSPIQQSSSGSQHATTLPAPVEEPNGHSSADQQNQDISVHTDPDECRDAHLPMMPQNDQPSAANTSTFSISCSTSSPAIPQANPSNKPRHSRSSSSKLTTTMSLSSVKQLAHEDPKPLPDTSKVTSSSQKSVLEKLKLFNSKGSSKTPGTILECSSAQSITCKQVDSHSSYEESDDTDATLRNINSTGPISSSPKIALKGIAQRTFSRALTSKKNSQKGTEKEKEKLKEKSKDASKPVTSVEKLDVKEEANDELAVAKSADMPKKSSRIANFIPKGGKVNNAKKETAASCQTNIPKLGIKTSQRKSSCTSASAKDGDRSRSGKLPSGPSLQKAQLDSRNSSSTSSLASSDGKGVAGVASSTNTTQTVNITAITTQTTGSNTVVVQLPQQQQQYNHPNMATVAPFMYRSQTSSEEITLPESIIGGVSMDSKTGQPCLEEVSGQDPESQRLRTMKNIADLRQNLEEAMSNLRGTQITHSTLETTFDTSVTTEVSGSNMLNLPGRPTPLSWRIGQSSPRLQAGDAPSLGNMYPPRGNASCFINSESGRYMYSAPLRRQLISRSSNLCPMGSSDKDKDEATPEHSGVDAAGYMSDGDLLGKSLRTDDIASGYMTDGGLGLYTRRLNRLPDGMAAMRETLQCNSSLGLGDADSWDDSSSVSSGISDTIDNLSTDDINTSSSVSSYANTPASARKNSHRQLQTDAEKHFAADRNSLWSGDEVKKSESGTDSGMKMEYSSKWRRNPSDISDESDKSTSSKKITVISQTGSWRRGMTAQVGITTPRTKVPAASTGTFKVPSTGQTDDAKVSERSQLSQKPAVTVHRSPSDAGRSSGDESKKGLSSTSRTSANTNNFGFKKMGASSGSVTLITSSGAVITSGSATVGKLPKSTALLSRPPGHKNSSDGSQHHDDTYLNMSPQTNLQYRSLPRPSKSSGSGRTGGGNRSSTSSVDSNVSAKSTGLSISKMREPVKIPLSTFVADTAHQADKEKDISSDTENAMPYTALKAAHGSVTATNGNPVARQQGTKYPDVSSPTFRRLFGGKQGKQALLTTSENMKNSVVISNPHATLNQQSNIDSLSASGNNALYSRNTDINQSSLASSPGSAQSPQSNSLSWGTNLSSSSAVSKDGLGSQSVSSLYTSCESIDVSLSSGAGTLSCNNSAGPSPSFKEDLLSSFTRTNSVKTTMSERCAPSFQLRAQEDTKDWLRSHSTSGIQDSAGNSPFSPGSSITSPSGGTRFNFAQLASPTTAAQMSLSNPAMVRNYSVPTTEGSYETYNDLCFRNSSVSLDEKNRTMTHSASFRDGFEEVRGSSLSLVSSTSSVYSTPEEKSQSEIRKLRRELDASQEKVAALTTQLTANAHLVAAFEQSLSNMTIRLQSLTVTAEQKDSELNELRKTIEMLKKQNSVAQTAINGVITTPEPTSKGSRPTQPGDLQIHRQHSSDSMSSVNSATSHSSIGSNMESDAKKKKKNWVNELRSSFRQAFGKKKSPKSASSHSDVEEMTDSSLPSSPKLPHNISSMSATLLRGSRSQSLISDCRENEAETVMQLRNELRDKEMKLTDIRLEALSSAHQLDQLREAMNKMQAEIEKLKAENDRLKSENHGNCNKTQSQLSVSSSPACFSNLSQHSLNLTESTSLDMLLGDPGDGSTRKEGRHVKVVVTLQEEMRRKEDSRPCQFLIGCIGVSGKTKWDVLDGVVRRLFKEYIVHVDPVNHLGLNSDSIHGYSIGEVKRTNSASTPELLPCGYLVGENNKISVTLKGVSENSVDNLVFESLIPKNMLQSYISLLKEHRRIILSGPSGTGKTFLANRLAEYVVLREGRSLTDGVITSFNVDHKSSKELRHYLSSIADRCSSECNAADMPVVIVLDNLHHINSLGDIFSGLLNCKHHKCPYIIGTMNQTSSSTPNLQLHHNFRWVLCANHTEPVRGFLSRYIRRKLIETEITSRVRNTDLIKIVDWIPKVWQHINRFLEAHSSSDVTVGPRLFLSCPIDVEGSRVWFTDLWNYSIVPYLLEAVREGRQLYGRRAPWEDPTKWVTDTYPWAATLQQHEWPHLLQLRPEDVGFDGLSLVLDGSPSKQLSQSDAED